MWTEVQVHGRVTREIKLREVQESLRTVVETASGWQADRAAVEIVGATAADVARVLGNDIDVVKQCREASVDELGRHQHVAKQQTEAEVASSQPVSLALNQLHRSHRGFFHLPSILHCQLLLLFFHRPWDQPGSSQDQPGEPMYQTGTCLKRARDRRISSGHSKTMPGRLGTSPGAIGRGSGDTSALMALRTSVAVSLMTVQSRAMSSSVV